jgi:hypothetical protein
VGSFHNSICYFDYDGAYTGIDEDGSGDAGGDDDGIDDAKFPWDLPTPDGNSIIEYSDVADKINEAKYLYVTNNLDEKNKTTVKYLNQLTKAKYRNSAELRKELLGSTEVPSADVKAFVNYDYTDLKTSLTELDNTKRIYFHVVVNDKALYGKKLTLKYTTQFGYSQTESVTVSEGNNSAVMMYPATQYKNYKVVFELLNSDGTKIASQTITF